jgi:hypothetical protein
MDDPTNTYPSSAGPTIFSSLVSGSTNAIASITFPIAAWRVTNTSTAGTVSVTRPELVEMFVRAREIVKAYHGIVTKQSSNELMIELPAGNAVAGALQLSSAGYDVVFIGIETRLLPAMRMREIGDGEHLVPTSLQSIHLDNGRVVIERESIEPVPMIQYRVRAK